MCATRHAGRQQAAGQVGAGHFDSGAARTAPQGQLQVGDLADEKYRLRQEPSHAAVGIIFCE